MSNNNNQPSETTNTPSTSLSNRIDNIPPMTVKKLNSFMDIFKVFDKDFYAQIKYDGERVQIHKLGDSLKLFSKNSDIVIDPDFKEILLDLIKVDSIILDGEYIKVDPKNQNKPFSRYMSSNPKFVGHHCIRVFDILYLNDLNLTSNVFSDRKQTIQDLLDNKGLSFLPGRLEMVEEFLIPIKNGDSVLIDIIQEHLVEKKIEGLVFKHQEHKYGKNKKEQWYKYKRITLGKVFDYDFSIIGASGDYQSILLGVYDKVASKFKTVTWCHVRVGLLSLRVVEDMVAVKNRKDLANHSFLDISSKIINKKTDDGKFKLIYVLKELSISKVPVVEITVEELLDSMRHTSKISCRTPMLVRFREDRDKDYLSATQLEQLIEDLDFQQKEKSGLITLDLPKKEIKQVKLSDKQMVELLNHDLGGNYLERRCYFNLDNIKYTQGSDIIINPESIALFIDFKPNLSKSKEFTENFKGNRNWYHISLNSFTTSSTRNVPIFSNGTFTQILTDVGGYFSMKEIKLEFVCIQKIQDKYFDSNGIGYFTWNHVSTFLNLFYSSNNIKVLVSIFKESEEFKLKSLKKVNVPVTRLRKRTLMSLADEKDDQEDQVQKKFKGINNKIINTKNINNSQSQPLNNYYKPNMENTFIIKWSFLYNISSIFKFLYLAEDILTSYVGKGYYSDRLNIFNSNKIVREELLGETNVKDFMSFILSQNLKFTTTKIPTRTIFKFKDLTNNIPQLVTKNWYYSDNLENLVKKRSVFTTIRFIFDHCKSRIYFAGNINRYSVIYDEFGNEEISRCVILK